MYSLHWSQLPLVRPLLALVVGLVLGQQVAAGWPAGVVLLVVTSCVFFFLRRRRNGRLPADVNGLLLLLALVGCGWLRGALTEVMHTDARRPQTDAVLVCLRDDPQVRPRSVKVMADIRAVHTSSGWEVLPEGVAVIFARTPAAERLRYGDELLLHTALQPVPPPRNPGEFDYPAYLRRKGTLHQVFVKTTDWQLLHTAQGNSLKAAALHLRRYFGQALSTAGLKGDQLAVATALLLGNDDQLDPGLLHAYSASGTLHVLSVSGMHVALLFTALSALLTPLRRLRRGALLRALLLLATLWGYALITGASPSVLRAVTMLSFVIAGQPFRRNGHILNMLAASALVLLMADPQLLVDIGFQLSFLAVGGIVVLQPLVVRWWQPTNRVVRWVWELVAVTLVAQVVTFPLGLYYFGQFPVYFLVSNLVVIPLSTLVMYGGIGLLVLSPFPTLASWLAVPVAALLDLLNGAVRLTEFLPMAVLHTSRWTLMQLLLLYGLLSALGAWVRTHHARWLMGGAAILALLLVMFLADNHLWLQRRELIVYSLPGATAIDVIRGREHLVLTDSLVQRSSGLIDFHLQPGWQKEGLKTPPLHLLRDTLQLQGAIAAANGNWIQAGNQLLFCAGRGLRWRTINNHCDILLLRQNTACRLDSLLRRTTPTLVLADGSNSPKKIEKWKTICNTLGVDFRDVRSEGAFVLPLK